MARRFGTFELDEERRELRLDGTNIPLQPRVFDLLVLLHENRHRVVSKNELLDRLWPGVVVGDGSLQRAVSLARSALKKGGLGHTIRNYARQGYRLCLDGEPDLGEPMPTAGDDALEAARAAFGRGAWDDCVEAYRRADAARDLDAADLEQLADACQCSGRPEESEPVLERAAAAYSARGDRRGAARMVLKLAEIAFESGRPSVAQGWLSRGRRYLENLDDGWERGFEAYLSARIAIMQGEPEAAGEHARRGIAIGRAIGSDDIEAINRIYVGFSELSLGDVPEGLAHIDEAGAAVIAGNVGPRAGGIVYCGLVWVCCNRGDWQRAVQWSESFARWCEQQNMLRFSGLCQLHRAEILSVSGVGREAEHEIHKACERLAKYSPYAEGDAFRILGDLQLMRGELDEAEAAFRRAHELGWDPQPGLAMLQAERGNREAAIRALLRSLEDSNWALQQRRGLLLAVLVIIAAQNGQLDRAREAMEELHRRPELWASDFHGGAVSCARAELAALEGRTGEAVTAMREAIRSWQAARAGLRQANCRFRLAQLLADEGDAAGARLELDAAEAAFHALQAPAHVKACARFREALPAAAPDVRPSGGIAPNRG